jgi:hypothetical protein
MASAVSLTSASLQSSANVFQVFQPMGGEGEALELLGPGDAGGERGARDETGQSFHGCGGVVGPGSGGRRGRQFPLCAQRPAQVQPGLPALGEPGLDQLARRREVDQRRLGLLLQGPDHLAHVLARLGPRFLDRLAIRASSGRLDPLGQVLLEEPDLRLVGGDQVGPAAPSRTRPSRPRGS